jgi:UTP--glucose-1-phosphate uridylyltransferase
MIRKAIIPAAGWGTRFLPATKAVPKEMLPIVDKPVIQYVVEEAVAAGITDICIVVSEGKGAIREHFSRNAGLEVKLAAQGKSELLDAMKRISEMAHFTYVLQKQQKGLGDAIYCGKDFAASEPFAVLLGDTIIGAEVPAMRQTLEVYEKYGEGVVLCEEVDRSKVSRYGVIDAEALDGGVFKVHDMVEKPSPQEAPSNLVVASRYIFMPEIFRCIEQTRPGKGGEIQITDAMRLMMKERPLYARKLTGRRYDIGDVKGFIEANLALGGKRFTAM